MVNVVDLMRLQSEEQHPHGLSQREYEAIFTADKPIVFAFHGYPSLIHEMTYKRRNKNIHVRGYIEEGHSSPRPSTCACSTASTASTSS